MTRTAYFFKRVCGILFAGLLSSCSTTLEIDQLRQARDIASFQPLSIDVPFYAQEEFQCGPAALAMLLNWGGVNVSPEELKPLVYVPAKQGSFPLEVVAAARQYNRIPYVIKPALVTLLKELEAGHPVLVFQNLGLDWFPRWHFAVVTGIDISMNEVTLHSGSIESHKMSIEQFERTWSRAKKWAMVALDPLQLPATAEGLTFIKEVSYFEQNGKLEIVKAAYQAAIRRWPDDFIVLMANANFWYQQNSFEIASHFYEKILQLNKNYAPAHNNLALVLLALGKYDEARVHAEIAISLGGKYSGSFNETLSQIEQRSGITSK